MRTNARKEVTSFVAGSSGPAAAHAQPALDPAKLAPPPRRACALRLPRSLPGAGVLVGGGRLGSREVRARARSRRALARSTPHPLAVRGCIGLFSSCVRGRTLSCGEGWSRGSPPRRRRPSCLPLLCLGLCARSRGGGLGRERRQGEVPSRWAAPGRTEGLGY